MTEVLAFDPGLITGVAYGQFTRDKPLELLWAKHRTYEEMQNPAKYAGLHPEHVVVEEFVLRDNDFRANLIGVRVEGMIEVFFHGQEIHYRPPSKKSQVPDQILKDNDLWMTGKDVDWTDGRDANDAIIHLLGYVAFDLNHLPTLRKYFR